jgi:alkylated DNA repair dioxygenase AlkB
MRHSSLPNFHELGMHGLCALANNPDAPSGVYCLDDACQSSVVLKRGALPSTPEDINALETFMSDDLLVLPTPNTMGGYENPDMPITAATPTWKLAKDQDGNVHRLWKTRVRRKQATFGAKYDFGQSNTTIALDDRSPSLVRDCLTYAKGLAKERGLPHEQYNGVHVNLYSDGKAGVAKHFDKEADMVQGYPIFSFTYLGVTNPQPRSFSIYKNDKLKTKIADVLLHSGDLLIMQGDMQQYFLHGVEATTKKQFENARRLNLTVRAFHSAAVDAAKAKKAATGQHHSSCAKSSM